MSQLYLIERTIHRYEGSEREVIGQLISDDHAGAETMLETIADRDSERTSIVGHHTMGTWERGSYWVCQTCHVHPDFGRCYTEWEYRLLSAAGSPTEPAADTAKVA